MTDKIENQPVSLKLTIISVLLVILIFMSIMYLASWSYYNSFKDSDTECRICANEHNLTCVEREPLKSFYTGINNINVTYLDCVTTDYQNSWDYCKSCYAVDYYGT